MTLVTGQILQNCYRIEALLGQGGYGAVYKATDLHIHSAVAVKENEDTSPEAQRQFAREADLLVRLRHPALPRVSDYFLVPSQGQYLVMDYVDGLDLQKILEQHGPLDESQAVAWMSQVLDALAYLHSQNPPVIHRDVKPANVLITPDGRAVLVDLGIAKLYSPGLLTTIGARAVTPGYSPLEQYGQGATDARSDIYAAGTTLYCLLTGQQPPEAIELVTGTAQLVPPRQLNSCISPSVEMAILKAMATQPAARHAGAAQMKAALQFRVAHATQEAAPQATRQMPQRIRLAPSLPQMILIPAGPFLMGDGTNRKTVVLPDYYIAKTPITNAQYRLFVEASGHKPAKHWTRKGRIPRGKENHPVVHVTWHDAVAFCKWASSNSTARTIRLPSEAEWEKAARGADGRGYPWGNGWQEGLCNTKESSTYGTTRVGRYSPAGDSPYGCVDMAGNVWEWTDSRFSNGREWYMVRGGAWNVILGFAGCSFFVPGKPDDSLDNVGFRCVSSIPPSGP